jgi:hypothetical protein
LGVYLIVGGGVLPSQLRSPLTKLPAISVLPELFEYFRSLRTELLRIALPCDAPSTVRFPSVVAFMKLTAPPQAAALAPQSFGDAVAPHPLQTTSSLAIEFCMSRVPPLLTVTPPLTDAASSVQTAPLATVTEPVIGPLIGLSQATSCGVGGGLAPSAGLILPS